MNKILRFVLSFCFLCSYISGIFLPLSGQTQNVTGHFHSRLERSVRFRVLTWNVENLFDTLHDEGYNDFEFLPMAERHWDSSRYWRKQSALAKTLIAAGEWQPVDLIGLCEVENDSVVHHLCRRTRMARLGYQYVVTKSRDRRGIDVAILYQPETFVPIASRCFSVPFDSVREHPTRDILLLSGVLPRGDTLDVFITHFPSRRGGSLQAKAYRMRAAGVIRQAVDSLYAVRKKALVIVMGDFNDEPDDRCIQEILAPSLSVLTPMATSYPPRPKGEIDGTYYFRHRWSRIDQMLVSPDLLRDGRVLHTSRHDCHILALDPLLESVADGRVKPYRTYLGAYYHGGVSDHLPLFLDLYY